MNVRATSPAQMGNDPLESLPATASVPVTIEQTGLSLALLKSLLLKHVQAMGSASLRRLSAQTCLSGPVVEEVVAVLRADAMIELKHEAAGDGTLAFALTEKGRYAAQDARGRNGYAGPAPVTLASYRAAIGNFSQCNCLVTRDAVNEHFGEIAIAPSQLDQLGAAFNSQKAVFIYGSAGTGKTYVLRHLSRLFSDLCLVPHALAIDDTVVQLFDPQLHQRFAPGEAAPTVRIADGYDRRFVACQRPLVTVGGELTADMLEVQFDARQRLYQAPLQLKANNGIFFIDDIGRQALSPQALFNRWIIPMEERRDFLKLANGLHFEVPFDVQLVFSSNLEPQALADDAALRRIGFKIQFRPISRDAYRTIWCQELEKRGLLFDETVLRYALEELHGRRGIELLPCHPRDLIDMALTQAIYLQEPRAISIERLAWAWHNYFVQPSLYAGQTSAGAAAGPAGLEAGSGPDLQQSLQLDSPPISQPNSYRNPA